MRGSSLCLSVFVLSLAPGSAGALFASPLQDEKPAPEPADDAGVERRLAESEKARRELADRLKLLEKKVTEAVKPVPATAERVGRIETALAALERKIGGSSEAPGGLAARLEGLERAGTDLGKRLAATEAGLPKLRNQIAALSAARARYDKLLQESLALHRLLTDRVKQLKQAHESLDAELEAEVGRREAVSKDVVQLEKRLAGERERRRTLESTVAEHARRRQATEKALSELATEVTAEKRRTSEQGKALVVLDQGLRKSAALLSALMGGLEGQGRRIERAETFGRETRRQTGDVRDDLRGVKVAMLYSVRDPEANPYRDHYPYLGIVHEYLDAKASLGNGLEEGEGIRIRRISTSGPAHDSPLLRGDLILRVDGRPVRSSGMVRPGTIVSRWEKREPMPTYVTSRLPGDTIEIEYVQFGDPGRVRLTLSCRKCGEACPFRVDQERE